MLQKSGVGVNMRLPSLLSCSVLFAVSAAAQTRPICDVTCAPDPSSPTYGGTYQARTATQNVRGRSSVRATTVPGDAGLGDGRTSSTVGGSESYNYAISILNLPARNALDLNLAVYYNSRVWTIDKVNNTATFNADKDFPSYGFRLGFGFIEAPASGSTSYTLTEPDGSKRELAFSSGTIYASLDSSYIDWNTATLVLRRKDGTQWVYERAPGSTAIFRTIKIKDTNGNYISISYVPAPGGSGPQPNNQAISTITDTLGRVVTFGYDTNYKLLSITAPKQGGGTLTVATFTWGTPNLNYSFTLQTPDTVASGTSINVLTKCQYTKADGTGPGVGYTFTYGDWGIVTQIAQVSATGVTRSYVSYDYPSVTSALSDHPTFTTQTVFDGINTGNWTHTVTKTGGLVSSFAITAPAPANTVATTNLYTSGWQTGLVSSVTVQSGATTLRTTTNVWTQDNPSSSTMINPRLTGITTTLNDASPTQQSKVEFDYTTNGNVSEFREFDYGLLLVRKAQTDYLTTSAYTSAHILDGRTQVRVYEDRKSVV